MKILYFGGQKSGKSKLAEAKTLELSHPKKPYYLATYNNTYADEEMKERLSQHKRQRANHFVTIEEPFRLSTIVKEEETYLIDCVSMWILNTIEEDLDAVFEQLKKLKEKKSNIVFVLNDVNSGVIPLDKESRTFVDRTGIIGQKLASFCDEVYEVKMGLPIQLK